MATFDDEDPMEALSMSDSMPLLDRITNYMHSDILLHRLYLVRTLGEAIKEVPFASFHEIVLPALERLQLDLDAGLRQALVEQLPNFAVYLRCRFGGGAAVFKEGESPYDDLLMRLVPMVATLTTDGSQQVRVAAASALVAIAPEIKKEDIEPHLLPIIKSLANDTTEEEHRLEAVTLAVLISAHLSPEVVQRFSLPLLIKLSKDPIFRVRKAVATDIGQFCRVVETEVATQHLLPLYVQLCKDDIWGVRKASAESLVAVSQALPSHLRYSSLIEIFDDLVKDQSRWVKNAAFQYLGPFIATLEPSHITPKLLSHFTSMASNASAASGDPEISMFCAFNFPAVLLTVTVTRWSELKEAYWSLIKDHEMKVRRTLAFSIHEVARILGEEITESSLLGAFGAFLNDVDEVKIGILTNIASFLKCLSPSTRRRYLTLLNDIQTDRNWRFRKLIAKQLNVLSQIFDSKDTNDIIVPLSVHLCQDTFASVRKHAAKGVGFVINRLSQDNSSSMKVEVERQIVSMATHASCHRRQLFLYICENLVDQLEPALFDGKFLPCILAMSTEKVPNIRLILVQTLGTLLQREKYLLYAPMRAVFDKLLKDGDKDVKFQANKVAALLGQRLQQQPSDTLVDPPPHLGGVEDEGKEEVILAEGEFVQEVKGKEGVEEEKEEVIVLAEGQPGLSEEERMHTESREITLVMRPPMEEAGEEVAPMDTKVEDNSVQVEGITPVDAKVEPEVEEVDSRMEKDEEVAERGETGGEEMVEDMEEAAKVEGEENGAAPHFSLENIMEQPEEEVQHEPTELGKNPKSMEADDQENQKAVSAQEPIAPQL